MTNDSTLTWEDVIVQRIELICKGSFGLIDDPDNILNERVISALMQRGWKISSLNNLMELRCEYEDQIRQDYTVRSKRIIFIIRFTFAHVPFDISKEACNIHLTLEDFFPHLSYHVLRSLPIDWLPAIFENQSEGLAGRKSLDDVETAGFIIRECLGLDYASNPTLNDILSLLADTALHKLEIPLPLKIVLLSQLRNSTLSKMYDYVGKSSSAVGFLQEVWQCYIVYKLNPKQRVAEIAGNEVAESAICLDKNRELQTKVTALIAENVLQPVVISSSETLPSWMHNGLHYFNDEIEVLQDTLDYLINVLPGSKSSFNEWTQFAIQWAEWNLDYCRVNQLTPDSIRSMEELVGQLDDTYYTWLEKQYSSLLLQPYLPKPTCVNQVLNHLASAFKPSNAHPLAVVIMDGMSVQDWLIIRSEWSKQDLTWRIDENCVLALVPTLTSISRQALLSGKLPHNFEKSWLNTNSEETYWRSFWEERGLNAETVFYTRGLGTRISDMRFELESGVDEVLNYMHLSAAVFIVNTIDELVHSSVLGQREFYNRVLHWANDNRYLQTLVSRLLDRFETVVITSDHGHIFGKGIGDISLSSVAEERALRARVFKGRIFENLRNELEQIVLWPNIGLPQDATVILPKGRGLFAKPGFSEISHGGASIEETIVSFITITR